MMSTNDSALAAITKTSDGHRHDADHREDGPFLEDLLPWAATVLLHGAAVLIAILLVWVSLNNKPEEEIPITPVIAMAPSPVRLDYKPTENPATSMSCFSSPTPVSKEARKIEVIAAKVPPMIGAIASGSETQGRFTAGPSGVGVGTIFGPGPSGCSATSFVFVIDASGSMLDTLPFVAAELKRTIRTLSERRKHTFTVIFYQDDKVIEALSPGMKLATEENKRLVSNWLDSDALAPGGLSSPIKAIEQGLRYQPDLMFLLSDSITGRGKFELTQRELLMRVQGATGGQTKVNTIQFLYPDPLANVPGMKPTMQMISERTGGVYRYVSGKELGL